MMTIIAERTDGDVRNKARECPKGGSVFIDGSERNEGVRRKD
jgi:hypothetical protein